MDAVLTASSWRTYDTSWNLWIWPAASDCIMFQDVITTNTLKNEENTKELS